MTFDPDKNLKRIADEISDDNYGRPSVLKEIAWALESIARSMNADFETLEDHRDNFNASMEAFRRQHNLPSKP
jgi:hypothetical protein|tara:strand:- start:469 stop:687 length:219 start_codon:yes stop_codon:yes gene_type:complete